MMGKKRILYVILAVSIVANCIFMFSGCMGQGFFLNNKETTVESITENTAQSGTTDTSKANAAARTKEIEKKLNEIDNVINNYYLNDNEIDQEKMLDGIYSGYVDGLGENYTTYYSKDEYNQLLESSNGEYVGIGVTVSQNMNTGIITLVEPFENGPAYAAGILSEDILYQVEGEEVTGVEVNQVVSKIKGEEGTTVNLTIYRQSEDKYIDLTIERRLVQNPTIKYEMKDNSIGYIRITEFDEVTIEQFNQAIAELQKQGMKGLVFDVRNNPGGILTGVCQMLDRILPQGLLVYTMDKDGNKKEYNAATEDELKLPMVVLVNGNSASAAEIFTAALQDYKWATIMGTTTYGKGIVQVIIPLEDGSAVKATQSKYYTPNGISIHGDGVTPDIEVEYNKEIEGDNQLAAAMEQVQKQIDGQ